MHWPFLVNSARVRFALLAEDSRNAVIHVLSVVADDDRRTDSELARWALSDSGAALREQWASALVTEARTATQPLWDRHAATSQASPDDDHDGPDQYERLEALVFEQDEHKRLWALEVVLSSKVLPESRRQSVRERIAASVREEAAEVQEAAEKGQICDPAEAPVWPAWRWLGGHATAPRTEPPEEMGEEWVLTNILRSDHRPEDTLYAYRPKAPPKYLRVFALELWNQSWSKEASRCELFGRARTDPSPLGHFPIGADKIWTSVATSMSGDPSAVGKAPIREDVPEKVIFRWDDGAQLQLFIDDADSIFVNVAKRYGPEALGHLWALVLGHYASGRGPQDGFPWFPSEHLWILGREGGKGSSEYRRMNDILDRIERSTMSAVYPDGSYTDPMPLARRYSVERNKRGHLLAAHVQLHPSLTYATAAGGAWWPADIALIRQLPRARAATAAAAPLAVLMANQWSQSEKHGSGAVFAKSIEPLAAAIGRPTRSDRATDSRTRDDLERSAEALQNIGYVKGYEISESGVFRAWPAQSRGQKPLRPPTLPATGSELEAWLTERGGSLASNAKAIGVSAITLRRGMRKGGRYLPSSLRDAIRLFMWPGSSPSEKATPDR